MGEVPQGNQAALLQSEEVAFAMARGDERAGSDQDGGGGARQGP